LRNKLFELKTKCGMIAYDNIIDFVKNNLYDMYSGASSEYIKRSRENWRKFNIEHVITASIIAPRPTVSTNPYINKEPYHDMHIVFPTLRDINDIRSNYIYKQIEKNRADAKKDTSVDFIINGNTIFDRSKKHRRHDYPNLEYTISSDKLSANEKYNNYVMTNKNVPGFDPKLCRLGDCVFQPSKEFSGDIARIVFYYYLMYAYDFTTRPFTGEVWFASDTNNNCGGFDMNEWTEFFYNNLDSYYHWAKEDEISKMERNRNKIITQKTNTPNIFVGFYYRDGNGSLGYGNSDFKFIDDLLFGREHDHKRYTNINFYDFSKKGTEEIKEMVNGKEVVRQEEVLLCPDKINLEHPLEIGYKKIIPTKLQYEPDVQKKFNDKNSLCKKIVIGENKKSYDEQLRLYKKPTETSSNQGKEPIRAPPGNKTIVEASKEKQMIKNSTIYTDPVSINIIGGAQRTFMEHPITHTRLNDDNNYYYKYLKYKHKCNNLK
jgi:endonuclease I